MNLADLEQYNYTLPEALIRKEGVEPRDSARLFVYDTSTDTVTHDFFYNVAKYLPENSLLVLNDTRVVPARLHLKKATGGKIEVFVLMNEWNGKDEIIPMLVDRKCGIGWKLFFPNGDYFEMMRQEANKFFAILKPSNSLPESLRESLRAGGLPCEIPLQADRQSRISQGEPLMKSLGELLEEFGETPIPPYLKEEEWLRDEKKLRMRYQTIFAEQGNSVAAPTAALHFTDRVFESLKQKNIDTAHVTLDVGLGTFAKLKDENFVTKKLHRERISASDETAIQINTVKKEGRKIIPVGTTALRTLESCIKNGSLRAFAGDTDIFISPPHHFQSADILITNFHIPKSSLMLLVDAFLRDKGAKRNLIQLYEEAIREKYAFYSFGDSMLIL
jgi:S-adenosylmethionine:tRNA ribosyltransferase-isomerase